MARKVEPHLTAIQQRMLAILSDGLAHPITELRECLHDELGPDKNIMVHICWIRKYVRPLGQDVVYQRNNGRTFYCLMRRLNSRDT
jgi:hypothetical protein